ncbi:GAF domain-containing protein [Mucilaginibacter sp. CSA2-8R]|uniref:GAF domain-containing protein n=1 Tax=Mucilaginibacter sp. CSA2-8R TaxID=3141542 RepID=UPI00315DF10C
MPFKEQERLRAVNRFLQLELSKEKELQEIVTLAANVCGKPSALISLIDQDKQLIKFKHAFDFDIPVKQDGLCHHLVDNGKAVVISDVLDSQCLADETFMGRQTGIRFFAASPLITTDGHHLGSLCVLDQQPGILTDLQQQLLHSLARQIIQLLEFDVSLQIIKEQHDEARRVETELRAFFESSIDYHLLLGLNFEILAFNKAWSSYIQASLNLSLIKGASMSLYLHPDNIGMFYKDYQKALKGTAVFVKRRIKHTVPFVWHMIKFEPSFNTEGEIIGVAINSTDITRKVQQEEMVAAQEQSLREIALIQSHELRRPVASILGLMTLLKMDGHAENILELQLMERAVAELDEKIKLIVNHAAGDAMGEHPVV